MEKIKSNYDHKDYMRMAMLKHEETFKEQVYELHRLYRMQKVLMQSVAINQQKQERFMVDNINNNNNNNNKGFTIDYNNHHEPGQAGQQRSNNNNNVKSHQSNIISIMGLHGPENNEHIPRPGPIEESNTNVDNNNSVLDESEIELTLSLGPSTHNPRRRKMDPGHGSLSSSSTGSSQTRKTSPKNSNGTSLLARGDHHHQFTWRGSSTNFPQGSDLEPVFSNGAPTKNSPWLFQALSLKST